MIVSFLAHPVAAVLAFLALLGLLHGYEWTGRGEPSDGVGLAVFVAAYLFGYVFLPWWTQPHRLYQWWNRGKSDSG